MTRLCIALFSLGLLLGCSQQARKDSERLDALLASQKIDTVEYVSPMATNTLTGQDAQRLVASLHRTNRMSSSDWSKGQVQHVCLRSGTNEVCWFSLFESGTWAFGEYDFQLRQ
jgi:hypothetical protein